MRRRLAALVLTAAALGTSAIAAPPANATEISTCIVIVGVTVDPATGKVTIDKIVVKSVGDCI